MYFLMYKCAGNNLYTRPCSAASSRHRTAGRPSPAHSSTPQHCTGPPRTPKNTNFLFYLMWRTRTEDKACFTMVTNIKICTWLSPFLGNNNNQSWFTRLDLTILWSCYKIESCNLVILQQDRILQSCDLATRSDLAILWSWNLKLSTIMQNVYHHMLG